LSNLVSGQLERHHVFSEVKEAIWTCLFNYFGMKRKGVSGDPAVGFLYGLLDARKL